MSFSPVVHICMIPKTNISRMMIFKYGVSLGLLIHLSVSNNEPSNQNLQQLSCRSPASGLILSSQKIPYKDARPTHPQTIPNTAV
uniref:Uncharacterized protein n=1 Tax=Arion vulgaris TaxID=1028688 RepID=A0A0B7BEB6_9EUPU